MNKTLNEILHHFLKSQHNGTDSSNETKRALSKLGKSEHQVHEIWMEFDTELEKEKIGIDALKKSKNHVIIGVVLALSMGFLSFLSALKIVTIGDRFFLFYGGVASGILLVMNGVRAQKNEKIRKKRRDLKWENWG